MKKKLLFFFLHEFFGSLDFARGLFVLFLASRGMSMSAVGLLQTLLFWSNLVFELPAGLLADRFKRKYSIALGLVMTAAAAFAMPYADTFVLFALVFVFHGMGFALRSGADKALLYDELKAGGPAWSDKFVSLSSKARSLVNVGLVLAMGIGGFIQDGLGWNYVYGLFGACMLVAAVCVLWIDEGRHSVKEANPGEPSIGLVASVKIFFLSRVGRSVALFIFGMAFIEATHAPFFIYIQSYLKDGGMTESQVSMVIALSLALTSIGYLFVHRLDRVPFPRLVGICTTLLLILTSGFLLRPPVMVGVALFALIEMIPSLLFVHSDNYINHRLPTAIRASLLSVHSLINSVFISLAFLGGGRMLDSFSPAIVLGSLTVLPLVGLVFLSIFFSRQHEHVD